MLWFTLFNKIGKQPMSFSQHNHVNVVLENGERKILDIKYDVKGHPYLVIAQNQNHKEPL